MKYPCGIIKDLLPLYIDDICAPESKDAIEAHLSDCADCKQFYNAMKEPSRFDSHEANTNDTQMANSLKQVKRTISRKIRNIVLCAAAAVALCIGGYWLLFQAPIKEVPLEDVSISANVYSLEELKAQGTEAPHDSDIDISSHENDRSTRYEITVPELGSMTITEEAIQRCKCISTISLESDYFLRTVKKDIKDNIIYITAIKTTVLNNKAGSFNHRTMTLEFQEIDKIVYVDKNGAETLLWSE